MCSSDLLVLDGGPADFKLNTALDDPVYGCPTIWISSPEGIKEILRLAGFNPVAEIHLIGGKPARETNYDRITLLAQAVTRETITSRTKKLIEFHNKIQTIGGYNYLDFENPELEQSILSTVQLPNTHRYLNIWSHPPKEQLQPIWQEQEIERATVFKIGENSDFCRLVERNPDGAFTVEDLRYLPSKYPGQCMPEGMRWGLKQLGNLHILDFIKTWGLVDVLEIGPGFNLYFPNHLPEYCCYTGIDDEGFYDLSLLKDADVGSVRRNRVTGLLGKGNHGLKPNSFDACISVSVLEHVPAADIEALCNEMYELLRPGGWALHSIDVSEHQIQEKHFLWFQALSNAGFLLKDVQYPTSESGFSMALTEPNSIVMTFWDGLRPSIWDGRRLKSRGHELTLLVAVRKLLFK